MLLFMVTDAATGVELLNDDACRGEGGAVGGSGRRRTRLSIGQELRRWNGEVVEALVRAMDHIIDYKVVIGPTFGKDQSTDLCAYHTLITRSVERPASFLSILTS
jgi:hypothetical protein